MQRCNAHLWSRGISGCKCYEGHGKSDSFLGLASSIPRDQRVDQTAFGEVELGAVECNEQTHSIGLGWSKVVNNSCTNDGWSVDVS